LTGYVIEKNRKQNQQLSAYEKDLESDLLNILVEQVYLHNVSNQVRMGMRERGEGSIKAWQKKSNTERPCALQV